MDIWSPTLHLATWTAMSLLSVFSHEVTVGESDLKLCEDDKRECVTELRHCGPRSASSIQKTLNMSCCYHIYPSSMTCEWSQESNSHSESDVALVFSRKYQIISCQGIFISASVLNITARIKNYKMKEEIWSQPHTVALYDAIKPSPPVLTALGSTEDSILVSWRRSRNNSCRLRYKISNTHIWTQALVSIQRDQTLNYTIKHLLAFTVYRVSVACRQESGFWSDWSSDISARTLDRVPSRPPEVCYRVEETDPGGSFLLHLMWKDLNLCDAGGRILGYQVSYKPVKNPQVQDRLIQNVTEVTAHLVVPPGNLSVTVTAFNMAGYGPAAHLSIDTQRQHTLLPVSKLWVSTSLPAMKGLLVQWETPIVPPSGSPVSHHAVHWRAETHPSTSHWTTVDGFTTSTVIQDVDPDESYLISVFPVYKQQCGPPQSLPASLQQGALMEAVQLKVVGVTKTTVKVVCVWQRKAGPIRVNRYTVRLKKDSGGQTLSLWPDQLHLTLVNLKPNNEYSLVLLADGFSRNTIPVRTDFDEVPAVATATPLLLLAVTVFIISILSRTVYRSFFFPPISSPQCSTTGQWLMDPKQQKTAERNILDIEDFQVTDVLGEKSPITVGPNSEPSSEEDLHENTSLLSTNHLSIKLLALEMDYISDAPVITEHPLVSLQSYQADCRLNCRHFDRVFTSEEIRDADAALLRQTHEARLVDFSERSHQKEAAVKCNFRDLMANRHCVNQMTCEAEYVVNTSFLVKSDV
ncbi:interleukin-6 receptor subunit beta [Cottoperca gobio]|uniref:Interleukin-6 receptor subunit beta n=1 Tax=Cottoperca gobio TaxID=56716 RepID=A0A6J2QAQ4_COTGO|nr:interleukin-6 receptor subunit beta-like [Cottoperca gobio]